jgi:hypothetical protein
VAYLGSYLTDHIIYAEKVAARLLDGRDLTEGEEQERWVDNYQGVIMPRSSKSLPDGETSCRNCNVLDRYTRLPASVHAFRNRHWRPLHHMLTTTLTDLTGNISEIPLVNRVHAILARHQFLPQQSPRSRAGRLPAGRYGMLERPYALARGLPESHDGTLSLTSKTSGCA